MLLDFHTLNVSLFITLKEMDFMFLMAVVLEEEDLLDPFLLDVLWSIAGVTEQGAECDPFVIITCDNEASLLVVGVVLDGLDSMKVNTVRDGIEDLCLKH